MQLQNNFFILFKVLGPSELQMFLEAFLLSCYGKRSLKCINEMNLDENKSYVRFISSEQNALEHIQDTCMGQRNTMKYYVNRIILNAQRSLLTKRIFSSK